MSPESRFVLPLVIVQEQIPNSLNFFPNISEGHMGATDIFHVKPSAVLLTTQEFPRLWLQFSEDSSY